MATNNSKEVPNNMRRVCRLFERWRSRRKARLPIPDALWRAATEAASEHGVFQAAKVLRLDYTKLKRMTQTGAGPTRSTPPPRFVELEPPAGNAVAECVIELEGPRGKMRIHWKGTLPPDVVGLSRMLWESA
jgi:hypothetical protein